MQSGWQKQQQRKRNLIAWGSSIGIVAVAFLAWFLVETFAVDNLNDYSGPILVKLGSPEGQDLPQVDTQPDAQPEVQQPPPEEQPQQPDQVPPEEHPVDDPNAQQVPPSPSPAPSVAPSPRPSVAPSTKPSPRTSPRPSQAPRVSPAPSLTPIASPKASEAPKPVLVKGQEYGNSHELSSAESSGSMGRSLYVPINYYMPLPQIVDGTIYDRIQAKGVVKLDRRRQIFTDFYVKDGSLWRLSSNPPMEARPGLWEVLQDSGYDMARAEYKRSIRSDVVLTFTLGAPVGGKPAIKDLKIQTSSGNADIDAAVAYGFRQSTYFNDTGHDVNGRFTYRFE